MGPKSSIFDVFAGKNETAALGWRQAYLISFFAPKSPEIRRFWGKKHG